MTCRVSGDARNVNIVWSRLGGELPRGATQRDGVLTLPSVERSAQGRYVCTASMPSTGITRTAYVTLYIEFQPQPTPQPTGPGGGRFINPFTLIVTEKGIVCYSHTFENYRGIKWKFTKYLKESCCLVFPIQMFSRNAFVSKIFPKLSGLFWPHY